VPIFSHSPFNTKVMSEIGHLGQVGSGRVHPKICGSGWFGSRNLDPCTSLRGIYQDVRGRATTQNSRRSCRVRSVPFMSRQLIQRKRRRQGINVYVSLHWRSSQVHVPEIEISSSLLSVVQI